MMKKRKTLKVAFTFRRLLNTFLYTMLLGDHWIPFIHYAFKKLLNNSLYTILLVYTIFLLVYL